MDEYQNLTNSKEFSSQLNQGRKYLKNKNYSSAIEIFENCLKYTDQISERSKKMEILIFLGLTQNEMCLFNESIKSLQKGLEICETYINEYNVDRNRYCE
jgi:tetratricopeptide (TPR) repeat protein